MKYFVLDFSQNISKNEDLVQFMSMEFVEKTSKNRDFMYSTAPMDFCQKTLKNADFLKGTPYGFLSKNI